MRQHKDQLKDRIRELEARVMRMRRAAIVGRNVVARNFRDAYFYDEGQSYQLADEHLKLQPGDLDPIDGDDV